MRARANPTLPLQARAADRGAGGVPSRRRRMLVGAIGGLAGSTLLVVRPAAATPESMRAAIAAFTGGVTPRPGRVQLEMAALVENGNTVPVVVGMPSPMTEAEHVRRIALFTERNPDPGVAVFHFSPKSGRARVATRMRLATSQQVVAVAHLSDGSYWQTAVDVIVTLAACVEG